MKVICKLLLVILALGVQGANSDEPLTPPSKIRAVSGNGKFIAVSDPKLQKTLVTDSAGNKIWELPGWHRSIFISDDGQSVAIGYEGMNLIPTYDPNLELVAFWSNGVKIRAVKLSELFPTASGLKRTVSHYYWGQIEGIDKKGHLILTRHDGKQFLFDISTGMSK